MNNPKCICPFFCSTFSLVFFFLINPSFSQLVPVKIGISKASPNYINWLSRADSSVITVNLYQMPIDSAVACLRTCDGFLVSGGEDVYPGLYGKEFDTARCTEMNRHRDSLEIALIGKALELKMPIIGICRGHQILNVSLGGTLIVDIPTDVPAHLTHQCEDYLHCHHPVKVKGKTQLSLISRCDSAIVTTNHHQAVDHLSPMLAVNAVSGDRVIEGIEWKDSVGKSFLIGVQWHPERMEKNNPLSGKLADIFIEKSKVYHGIKIKKPIK